MSQNTKQNIVLIGGAGFIGHHLALNLSKRGHEVHVVDSLGVNNLLAILETAQSSPYYSQYIRMVNERLELLHSNKIQFHVCDARDYHRLAGVLNKTKSTTFVMLAAVSHADRSNKDPYSTLDHSLRTLENALDCARSVAVNRFVFFSSSMVYGNFATDEVTEETVCNPLGIYGAVKLSGEKIVTGYHQAFGVPYTIIRPSALYGERCVSRRVGQIFIENALLGNKITVSGDGKDRLDFTYIDDLVDGTTLALESPHAINQVFNMTYGRSSSIADLADLVKKEFPSIDIEYLPKDKLMPNRGTLSVTKARELLGYNPKFSIQTGIPKYIGWYKDFWNKKLSFS